ncbi:MAG: EamA family transporter [Candidatus Omnitrophota bacterium]|nr:EamA family transporter [Candidatus Omnitrophota bacterium]
MKELGLSWGMLILSVLCNVFGVFVIKEKINMLGAIKFESFRVVISYFWALLQSPLVIVGVILFFLAPFLFAIALSRMDIIVAYPAQIALNFVILIVFALIFLGEKITFYRLLGIMCTFIGIYFLNKKG